MQQPQNSSILLTGGHGATTGIAVIEEIKRRNRNINLFWIGSKSVFPGSSVTSLEYKIYPSMGVKYFNISAGKLQTKFTLYTIPLLFLIPVGFIQAFLLLVKIRPNVVLSFGGFASFPVVVLASLLGIPVILHEQTVVAGRASIFSAFFAKKVALARAESRKYFPDNKCVVTGNPVMKSILGVGKPNKLHSPPTIFVMGGSRGSEFINENIIEVVKDANFKINVIHVTGERDFKKYESLSSPSYTPISFLSPLNMARYYEMADIIICRSGANTVSELLCVKRPAILIPLPRTYKNEQFENGRYAENFGIAKVLTEDQTTKESLESEIYKMIDDWEKIVKRVSNKNSPDIKASETLVDILFGYLK